MNVSPKGLMLDVPALLRLDGVAGPKTYRVRIIGDSREFYRVIACEAIPFRGRWLKPGERGRCAKENVVAAIGEQP